MLDEVMVALTVPIEKCSLVIMTSKLFFQTSQPNGILTKMQNLNLPA